MKRASVGLPNEQMFEDEVSVSSEGSTPEQHRRASHANEQLRETLAKKETNAVRCLRLVVFSVLVGVAILFSVGVCLYMKKDEEDTFETQFYDLAHRSVQGFHANAKLRAQVLHLFATSVTSTALQTNQVFPFVKIADFDARATAARAILGSHYISMYNVIPHDLRRVWEAYTQDATNLDWLNESWAFQEEFFATHKRNSSAATYPRRLQQELEQEVSLLQEDEEEPYNNTATFNGPYYTNPEIFRKGDPINNPNDFWWFVNYHADKAGPFLVAWQTSPLTQQEIYAINYNLLDPAQPPAYTNGANAAMKNAEAVFAGVWNVDEEGLIPEDDDYSQIDVPISSFFYPVFDKITGEDKKVVALITLDYEFGPFFASVLPPNANSIVCVVSNCNQEFTFEVTGETAVYLGPTDLHDPKYDDYTVSAKMADFESSAGGTVYNGAPINEDSCPWELHVYATKDMEDEFVTRKPFYYMAAVLGVFLFTCLTFVVYDCLVEHRQKKVMTTAVKSDKIVSSLFPKMFREALYEDDVKEDSKQWNNNTALRMDNTGTSRTEGIQGSSNLQPKVGQPLAKLYSDCTVFFADIAGFTAWSSARNPEQVFSLLETIYAAFDKSAERHRIFKIETIGDCYVAVTGLPEPQPNHALLMVKFARDCLGKMATLTQKLEATLGPDTGNLAMRVGLHSGSVTAGVLRGQKARFQLFGDTVNTASRMESNGRKHCIHASQETADILVAMGKEHWVTAREDKIHAKGKGELQTYWIRPQAVSSITTRSMSSSSQYDDTFEVGEVEEALLNLSGAASTKRKWAAIHYRGVEWAVDILFDVLKEALLERTWNPRKSKVTKVRYDAETPIEEIRSNWDGFLDGLTTSKNENSTQREAIVVNEEVRTQLKSYVVQLAYQCKERPFHKFEHACQVLMSAEKMVSCLESGPLDKAGIKLTPEVKFALYLSSLVRDVAPTSFAGFLTTRATGDIIEKTVFQESLAIAWDIFKDDNFVNLRQCVCPSAAEQGRFIHILVNLVHAGDIMRWQTNSRYQADLGSHNSDGSVSNKQLASILEHISLASQWAHMVQHSTIYETWDHLLLEELTRDFRAGRIPWDPAKEWRPCEQRLLTGAIVPVAQKLSLPHVLGATGDQLLRFAIKNCQTSPSVPRHTASAGGGFDAEIEV